ncbi:MAG: RagB/SusD family nutrient uptake outer membrane protein [Flavobacteriaceae bacterium]|nr:RagB/SusD family nutrient uptake outer membrane protein [Flavobacteriaceae bacterium]
MKHLFFRIFIILLIPLLSLSSCSDDDDLTAGKVVDGEVLTNAEAISLANAVYPPLQTLSSSFSFLIESATESTISFEGEESKEGPLVSRFEIYPDNWYAVKIFNRLYESIGAANSAIDKLSTATPSNQLSQETIKLAIARVKFVRALSYHYLVQLFGEVPLVLTTTTPPSKVRASIDDVYAQIVKDLTEAEADLPAFDNDKSNPTKGAANAILARVYLVWGEKPLSFNEVAAIQGGQIDPSSNGVDVDKLQKAVEYASKVINSGSYTLLSDYEKIFGRNNENSAEAIFTIFHLGDDVDRQGNHQTHCPFTFPFELRKDNHIGPADVTLPNRFDDHDSRKHYSYATKLTNPADNKEYTYAFPDTTPRYGKFIHRAADGSDLTQAAQPNDLDRIEIRLAELYLIRAEALFFLNKAGEALTDVNTIRARAFKGYYDHNKLSALTKEDLFKEWELEFTFEQKRWSNLVRWRNLISTVKTVDQFTYYKDDYKDEASIIAKFGKDADGKDVDINAAFFAKIYKHLHAKYTNVRGKHYRFPIPPGESGQDLGITPQNPGY